ncbi:MAG: hypothetical protein GF350_00015 [Chitinivibrionales bacterium]|nr:hypothetical protein [Chitinivibrionales bacterium]
MIYQKHLLLLVCLTVHLFAGFVTIEGPSPVTINKWELQADYAEIYSRLAPGRKIDRTPLTIRFYKSREVSGVRPLLPEWGGGGAVGTDLIIIPVDKDPFLNQSFIQVAFHEMVHIVLNRAYPSLHIPRWFHEGVALSLSGDLAINEHVIISWALFIRNLVALADIDSVNLFTRSRANLAYCQSRQAVQLLIRTYDIDIIPEILVSAKQHQDFWKGVHDTLGLTRKEFARLAREDLHKRYSLLFVFADTYLVWFGIIVLFIIAVFVTRFRNRKKLESITESENYETGQQK